MEKDGVAAGQPMFLFNLMRILARVMCVTLLVGCSSVPLPTQQSEADGKPLADVRAKVQKSDAVAQYYEGLAYYNGQGVATNYVEAAKRFHEKFGADKQANVATVECPATQAVVERADGFIKGFTEADPKAKVVARVDGKCVRDEALAATEDLLQKNPEVNVIYGGNGDSALGALAALQGAGRGTVDDVFLVSHDGSEPELIELVNPKSGLKLAVANRPKELARQTIDTLFEVLAGKVAMDKDLDVPVAAEVLTPDNLDKLQQFLAAEYFGTTDLKQYAK